MASYKLLDYLQFLSGLDYPIFVQFQKPCCLFLGVAVKYSFTNTFFFSFVGSGLVMMILGGQILAYRLFRNNYVYPADLQNF